MADISTARPENELGPRTAKFMCFLLIGGIIPIVFLFEVIFVLPDFHQPGGFWHTFTILWSIFVLFNVNGNWLACILIETNVNFKTLQPPDNATAKCWHHCSQCNKLAPPRSWHCSICHACILKRDHHCLFTSCCVGHRNHRYFIMFICYFLIGASYTFVYNSMYLWVLHGDVYRNWSSLFKMLFPPLMLTCGCLYKNLYLLFYYINVMGLLLSMPMLTVQMFNVLHGGVCYDTFKVKSYKYDAGWRHNLQNVFGKRMQLVWLSPLIFSELPHDGVQWQTLKASADQNSTSIEEIIAEENRVEEFNVVQDVSEHLNILHQTDSSQC